MDRFFMRYAGLLELTQDLRFWKFLFLGRLHIFPHWRIFVRIWCDERGIWSTQYTDEILSLPNMGCQLFASFLKCTLLRLVYLDGRIVENVYKCLCVRNHFQWGMIYQKSSKTRWTETSGEWNGEWNQDVLNGCRGNRWPVVFGQDSSIQGRQMHKRQPLSCHCVGMWYRIFCELIERVAQTTLSD